MKKEEYHTITEDLGAKFEAAEKAIAELKKTLVATKEAIGAEDSIGLADIKYGLLSASDVYVAFKFEQAIEKLRDAERNLTANVTGARDVAISALLSAMCTDPEVKNA